MFVDVDRGIERVPYLMLFEEKSAGFKDVYGGVDSVVLRSHLLRPHASTSDTVIVFMHPIGGGEYLPLPMALAKAGHHVIYCQSRYPNNDTALIMEKVAVDLAECIRDAKQRLGYARVILGGWSGGGSLALFYQRQAEHTTVACTPAGDPPDLRPVARARRFHQILSVLSAAPNERRRDLSAEPLVAAGQPARGLDVDG